MLDKIKNHLRTDGLLHLCVSAILMFALGWVKPLWIGVLIVFLIGVGKEVYDKVSGKGCAELHDIVCDCLGILMGLVLIFINLLGR